MILCWIIALPSSLLQTLKHLSLLHIWSKMKDEFNTKFLFFSDKIVENMNFISFLSQHYPYIFINGKNREWQEPVFWKWFFINISSTWRNFQYWFRATCWGLSLSQTGTTGLLWTPALYSLTGTKTYQPNFLAWDCINGLQSANQHCSCAGALMWSFYTHFQKAHQVRKWVQSKGRLFHSWWNGGQRFRAH